MAVCKNDKKDIIFAYSKVLPPWELQLPNSTCCLFSYFYGNRTHKLNYVCFEGDSKMVSDALVNLSASTPNLKEFIAEIKPYLNSFLCWDSIFVHRHVNFSAHFPSCPLGHFE